MTNPEEIVVKMGEGEMEGLPSQPCGVSASQSTAGLDARPSAAGEAKRWWWLSEMGPHGYGKPVDGPHETREGVEQALYLYHGLGLSRGRSYVCAEIIETPVTPKAHDTNEAAVHTLRQIMGAPAKDGTTERQPEPRDEPQ